MQNKKEYKTTQVIQGRLQYAQLFEPRSMYDDENASDKKYSLTLLIDKKDTKTVDQVKQMIQAAIERAIDNGITTQDKIASSRNPLRDGDVEKPDRTEFKGAYFINIKSSEQQPPKVYKIEEINNSKVIEKAEPKDVYNGCYVAVETSLFYYKKMGHGVSAFLLKVLKTKDGEMLTTETSAQDAFQEFITKDDLPF